VGTFVADSGETNGGANIGDIHTFNGWSILPEYWWNTEEARQINGTDGSLLPPYLTKDTKLQVYVTDICRSVELTFEKEVNYKGVNAYRFVIGPDAFNTSLPKNRGFCNANGKQIFEQNEDNECLPPGLLDISRCQTGFFSISYFSIQLFRRTTYCHFMAELFTFS
jgi:scavenger receptor class B, member 1